MTKTKQPFAQITAQLIIDRVHSIRGMKVMLDKDLAEMYGVQTSALNQAIKGTALDFRMISCFNYLKKNLNL